MFFFIKDELKQNCSWQNQSHGVFHKCQHLQCVSFDCTLNHHIVIESTVFVKYCPIICVHDKIKFKNENNIHILYYRNNYAKVFIQISQTKATTISFIVSVAESSFDWHWNESVNRSPRTDVSPSSGQRRRRSQLDICYSNLNTKIKKMSLPFDFYLIQSAKKRSEINIGFRDCINFKLIANANREIDIYWQTKWSFWVYWMWSISSLQKGITK